jgi:hypothetical protein
MLTVPEPSWAISTRALVASQSSLILAPPEPITRPSAAGGTRTTPKQGACGWRPCKARGGQPAWDVVGGQAAGGRRGPARRHAGRPRRAKHAGVSQLRVRGSSWWWFVFACLQAGGPDQQSSPKRGTTTTSCCANPRTTPAHSLPYSRAAPGHVALNSATPSYLRRHGLHGIEDGETGQAGALQRLHQHFLRHATWRLDVQLACGDARLAACTNAHAQPAHGASVDTALGSPAGCLCSAGLQGG